jgi:hypothetical protein
MAYRTYHNTDTSARANSGSKVLKLNAGKIKGNLSPKKTARAIKP